MLKVLVTGASRGIGEATVVTLVKRGHEVIATVQDLKNVKDLGATAVYPLDVTDPLSIGRAVAAAGDVDVLINAAGAPMVTAPIEHTHITDAREQFSVNCLGPMQTIQAVLPGMRRHGSGHIVTIGCMTGQVAEFLRGAVHGSKGWLERFHESLKYEVNHFGINVTLVEPGAVVNQPGKEKKWQYCEDYGELFDQFTKVEARLDSALGKLTPEDVATAVADCIESDKPPFRLEVGNDARAILAIRRNTTDEEFEQAMREMLKDFTW